MTSATTTSDTPDPAPVGAPESSESTDATGGGPAPSGGPLGPATWTRALVLGLALAVLGGAIGWTIGQRHEDPLSRSDVGFMQDMYFHHTQAVQMTKILLFKPDVSRDLDSYAEEILADQRYEQGLFNAILDRYDEPVNNPDETAMGWMGRPVRRDQMTGLATEQQMAELNDATGADAEALFIALMTEHHLGGLHMADYEARHGKDATVRKMARAMVKTQRGEVIDLNSYRLRKKLPIPTGFGDPLKDPRLNPLSLTQD